MEPLAALASDERLFSSMSSREESCQSRIIATAAPQNTPLSTTSNIPSDTALFLRNLRLLNLDLLSDWPRPNLETFSPTKDAITSQKGRVRAAEWVLYRLFEIWDPKETKTKLRPLFPALEPLQSIKLRAALLQWLILLKSTKILGRECMIRKSMLDDCRGEKFVEILLHFSTAVLRKRTKRRDSRTALACGINENASTTLSYVREASLRRLLQSRDRQKQSFRALAEELRNMTIACNSERGSAEQEAVAHGIRDVQLDLTELKKQLSDDCKGDDQWLSIAFSGERDHGRDSMIEDTFGKLWHNTLSSSKDTAEPLRPCDAIPSGIVADLEQRVRKQQERVAQWHVFQNELSQRNGDLIVAHSPLKMPLRSPQKPSSSRNTPQRNGSTRNPKTNTQTSLRLQALQASPSKKQAVSQQAVSSGEADPQQKPLRSPPDVFKRPQITTRGPDPKTMELDSEERFCDEMAQLKLASPTPTSPVRRPTRLPSPSKSPTRQQSHTLMTGTSASTEAVTQLDDLDSSKVSTTVAAPSPPTTETLSERTARTMASWTHKSSSPTKERSLPSPRLHGHTQSVPQPYLRASPTGSPARAAILGKTLPPQEDVSDSMDNATAFASNDEIEASGYSPRAQSHIAESNLQDESMPGAAEIAQHVASKPSPPTTDTASFEDMSPFKPSVRLRRTPPGSPSPFG